MTKSNLSQTNNRDSTFDLMRLLSLVMIVVLHHMPSYYFNFYDLHPLGIRVDLSFICHLLRYMGIGTFVFMSGYLLSARRYPMRNPIDLWSFLKKRFNRIFPLYWLALLVFIIMFYLYTGRDLGTINVILHVFGLQMFFGKSIPTLWFVGLITVYYMFFAYIEYATQKRDFSLALYAFSFLLLILSKVVSPLTDNRLILYLPVFAFGVWFSRKRPAICFMRFIIALAMTIGACYFYLVFFEAPESLPLSLRFILDVGILNLLMSSFVMVSFYLCRKCNLKVFSYWAYIGAYSSYAIYLFHGPLFQITKTVLEKQESLVIRTLVFALIIGILFPFSYAIQRLSDIAIEQLTSSNRQRLEKKNPRNAMNVQSQGTGL